MREHGQGDSDRSADLSARMVQYHLSRVFAKPGISSRSQLDRALPLPAAGEARVLTGHCRSVVSPERLAWSS